MFLQLSVILFTGDLCLGGGSPPGRSLSRGSVSRGGGLLPGGLCPMVVSVTETPLYGGREGDTHPTGMHSCLILFLSPKYDLPVFNGDHQAIS